MPSNIPINVRNPSTSTLALAFNEYNCITFERYIKYELGSMPQIALVDEEDGDSLILSM
uniref:Uncharacterized protein n=1 Tax=Lepeophtheirus salmonis TaxID=72036 RepID=A0A0K2UDA2_LEPSM